MIGRMVRWPVRSTGRWRYAQIAHVVPAGRSVESAFLEAKLGRQGKLDFRGTVSWRDHDSYIVRVNRGIGVPSLFFWPKMTKLEVLPRVGISHGNGVAS